MELTGLVPPGVAGALADVDVLVLPNRASEESASYTSPLKLFEYLAAGRPIVASRFARAARGAEDGDKALLVAPDDPAALAEAMHRLIADPALAVRRPRGSLRRVVLLARRAERLERRSPACRDRVRMISPSC